MLDLLDNGFQNTLCSMTSDSSAYTRWAGALARSAAGGKLERDPGAAAEADVQLHAAGVKRV